jgi:hypothetical protein
VLAYLLTLSDRTKSGTLLRRLFFRANFCHLETISLEFFFQFFWGVNSANLGEKVFLFLANSMIIFSIVKVKNIPYFF